MKKYRIYSKTELMNMAAEAQLNDVYSLQKGNSLDIYVSVKTVGGLSG